jgi:hypothetical protein
MDDDQKNCLVTLDDYSPRITAQRIDRELFGEKVLQNCQVSGWKRRALTKHTSSSSKIPGILLITVTMYVRDVLFKLIHHL